MVINQNPFLCLDIMERSNHQIISTPQESAFPETTKKWNEAHIEVEMSGSRSGLTQESGTGPGGPIPNF